MNRILFLLSIASSCILAIPLSGSEDHDYFGTGSGFDYFGTGSGFDYYGTASGSGFDYYGTA